MQILLVQYIMTKRGRDLKRGREKFELSLASD